MINRSLNTILAEAEDRLEHGDSPDVVGGAGHPSIAQEYLWSFHDLNPENPAHNRPQALKLAGGFEIGRLRRALNSLTRLHPELRSVFRMTDGGLVCIDSGLSQIACELVELDENRPSSRQGRMQEFVAVPFDLENGPLIRARVFLVDGDAVLLLVVHHIITDASSAGILESDLWMAYSSDAEPNQSESTVTERAGYDALVGIQRIAAAEGKLERLVEEVASRLEGAPTVLDLPTDRPLPPVRSGRGISVIRSLDGDSISAIENLARSGDATPAMVLSALFATLLHRYTGATDILYAVPHAGRTGRRHDRTVGLFMNFLVQRARLEGTPSFLEFLARVREDTIAMLVAAEAPFELVARRLHPERPAGQTPLTQAIFNMEAAPGETGFRRVEFSQGQSTHDLSLEVIRRGSKLTLEWTANADIFDTATLERIAGHYENLLNGVLEDPGRRVGELPLMTDEERRAVLRLSHPTGEDRVYDVPAHELFEAQVELGPNETAVFDGDQAISYLELNRRANRIAHALRASGVGAGDFVPVIVERSTELAAAWIGVAKTGAAFVALDSLDSIGRLVSIAEDVSAKVVLTESGLASEFCRLRPGAIVFDVADLVGDLANDADDRYDRNPQIHVEPGDPCWVVFTSGSTGRPKGVFGSHASMTSLCLGDRRVFEPRQISLAASSPSFDAAITDFFAPLMRGGAVVISRERIPTARAIADAVSRFGVNDLWLTASVLHVLLDESPESLRGLPYIATGGEVLSLPHVLKALRELPGTTIVNWYGAMEASMVATEYPVPSDLSETVRSVPIGRPFAGRLVYILDEGLEPVPIGVPGEIFFGGDYVALGYVGNPEETARRFVPDRFRDVEDARMYRTGDLGRFLPSGDIEFLGRIDRQIKFHGVRLEPAEIEAAVASHPAVREAALVIDGPASDRKRLIMFYTEQDGQSVDPGVLRRHVSGIVSRHLVPEDFIRIDEMPRLQSSKKDLLSLAAGATRNRSVSLEPPETETEQRLASIWRKILDAEIVGATDDFFRIGGDSLCAVRLITEIDRRFGVDMSAAAIFDARTIREQAALLDSGIERARTSPLINVKAAGSKLPFFCVVMADVIFLEALARYLPEDQPLFGLQAPDHGTRRPKHTTIESMADLYVEEVLRVQPHGPYQLGGICTGAFVAIEMAIRLRRAGREVRCVVSFDTIRPPRVGKLVNPSAEMSLSAVKNALRHEPTSLRRRLRRWWRHFLEESARVRRRGLRIARTQRLMYRAREKYLMDRPFDGDIDLLVARNSDKAAHIQSDWDGVATGAVRRWPVGGTHYTMWQEPFVSATASVLSDVLASARERHGDRSP